MICSRNSQLLVGAPSHGTTGALSTGRVLAFDIAAGSQSAPVFTITGTQRLQRFGRCVDHTVMDRQLAVTKGTCTQGAVVRRCLQ